MMECIPSPLSTHSMPPCLHALPCKCPPDRRTLKLYSKSVLTAVVTDPWTSRPSHADVSCPHGARAADAAPLLHGDERGWRRVLCGIQPHRSMDRRARRLLPALSFEPLAGSQSVFATTGWRRAVPWRARGLAAAQAAGAAREESADGPQRHARPLTNVSC